MKNTVDNIKRETIEKLTNMITEFCDDMENGTRDLDNFININDIDNMWTKLQNETGEVYSDMVGELISSVNEKDLIAKKKLNMHN